jgi:uncharacterized protein YycO
MIRLRFVSHPGIFNWACRIAQYGFWATHCEAMIPTGGRIGAWYTEGGVKILPDNYDDGAFLKETFISLKTTFDQEKKFFEFLHTQVGKPYDALAIVAFYSSRDWQEPDSWQCSELIGTALSYCGLFPQEMAVKFSRITPRDLMLLTSPLTGVG